MINVVARQETLLHSTVALVRQVFEDGMVYTMKASQDTVNVALIAVKGVIAEDMATPRWKFLEEWLKVRIITPFAGSQLLLHLAPTNLAIHASV